jgi:ornithine cyclodeaminase
MKVLKRNQIRDIVDNLDLLPEIEHGFQFYSQGLAVVPPVGELILDRGEVHIKYGYLKEDEYYVIKIASGFYQNPVQGLPSGNGLMLLYSQTTGELLCLLHDEGYLTDVRTAAAGAIAARYLAPERVFRIGIAGTGVQARMQLCFLKQVVECREVLVWGRGPEQVESYRTDMEKEGFHVEVTLDIENLLDRCNLIVTTTPSKAPLLKPDKVKPGTHITAMGSDTSEKQELDAEILERAQLIVADSLEQCKDRGEIFQARKCGVNLEGKIVELGEVIGGSAAGRSREDQITIADLTGVAVQDIKIASAVYRATQH